MYRLGSNYYLILIFFIVVLILLVFVIQLFYYSPLAVEKYSDNLETSTRIGRILSKKFQLIEEYTPSKERSSAQHPINHIESIKLSQSNSSTPSITTSPIQIPHLTPNITPNPLSSISTSTASSSTISEICSSPNNESRRRRSSSISLPGSKTVVPLCENEYKNMYDVNMCISPNYEIAKSIVDDNLYRICRIPLSPEQALDNKFLERINTLAKLNHPYLPRYYKAWFERKDNVSNSFITEARLSYSNLSQYYKEEEVEKEKEIQIIENCDNNNSNNKKQKQQLVKEKNSKSNNNIKCLQLLLLSPSSTEDYVDGICDSPSTYEKYFIDACRLEEEEEEEESYNNCGDDYNKLEENESKEGKKKKHRALFKVNRNYNCSDNNRLERVPSLQDFSKDYILYIQIQFFHAPSLKEVLKVHKQVYIYYNYYYI